MILLDSNVLVGMANPRDPNHRSARDAVRKLLSVGEQVVVAPQCIIEAWVVLTRPANSPRGVGMTFAQAQRLRDWLLRRFRVLPDQHLVYGRWMGLVDRHGIIGVNAHDCRLAAFMAVHGIADILTFNASDFHRYPHVRVRHPASVVS